MANSRTRRTHDFPEKLAHRLNLYALCATAAGVSLAALAQPSEAKIIYTPAHHKLPINKAFNLDLNHDGITDFSLSASHFVAKTSTVSGTEIRGSAFLHLPKKSNSVVGYPSGYPYYASALKAGVRVGRGSPFVRDSKFRIVMGGQILSSHRGKLSIGPWNVDGKGVKNRYLGLKFLIKGRVHYGWARMNVHIYNYYPDVVLTGYAYETTPNKAITTGKTKGSTSPNTLGHLALGAASGK